MRQNQKRTTIIKKRKFMRLAIITLLVASILLGAWWAYTRNDKTTNDAKKTSQYSSHDTAPKIDMSPATEEDKKANDEHKDNLVEQQQAPSTPSANVTPVITILGQYGDNVEVSSYISGVIEDGGTCTMTATLGSKKITRQTTGIQNAKDTSCPTFVVPRSEFSSGSWNVVVGYMSAAHSGTSQARTMEIQ